MINLNLQNPYKFYSSQYDKSDTVVIDNGTYELKGGYLGGKVAIKFQNCFYKDTEGIKFESLRGKSKYTPFTYDMISGFHVLEENIDQVLEYLGVHDCNNLIITDAIYSPTKKDLLKFLFEVYRFKKIQIGVDGIYSYLYNQRDNPEKMGVSISLGHSSTCVYVIKDKKILDVYKINYGGKFALTYLTNIIRYKFKEYNKDYSNLIPHLKCSIDYDSEVFDIIEKMKVQDFKDSVCISEPVEYYKEEVCVDIEKRNRLVERLKNINKKRKTVEQEIESEEKEQESESEEKEQESELEEKEQESESEEKEQESESEVKEQESQEVDSESIPKEKKPMPGMFKIRLYQYNSKIQKIFKRLARKITFDEEQYEKITDLSSFLNKKKLRYEQILRELELREKYRKDSTNRKTYEFALLLKTGELTPDEIEYKKKIKECEDTKIDEKLVKEKDALLELISTYDSNYVISMSSILDLVSGLNMEKMLVNIDLLRIPEVLFEPSMLGSDQMGLGEILENILGTYKDIKEIFLTGGFSQISGLKERVEYECRKYSYNPEISVRLAENPVDDAFNGASFTDLFEIYTYDDFIEGKLD